MCIFILYQFQTSIPQWGPLNGSDHNLSPESDNMVKPSARGREKEESPESWIKRREQEDEGEREITWTERERHTHTHTSTDGGRWKGVACPTPVRLSGCWCTYTFPGHHQTWFREKALQHWGCCEEKEKPQTTLIHRDIQPLDCWAELSKFLSPTPER